MRGFGTGLILSTLAVVGLGLGSASAAADGKRATKDDYEIDLSASSTALKVGENGKFSLVIHAKNGTKVHPEAPLTVKLTPTAGVGVAKDKLTRADVPKDAQAPILVTTLTAKAKGPQKVEAEVSFFLCTDDWCQRMSDKTQLAVEVSE